MVMQFSEGLLNTGDINQKYPQIINMVPCVPPYEDVSYKARFSGGFRGDSQTWIKGRDGFTICGEDDLGGYHPTDIIEIEGKRYIYAVSPDGMKAKIFAQCNNDVFDGCSYFVKEGCCAGTKTDITEYSFKRGGSTVTQDFFPRTPCISDKFEIVKFPKGTPKANRCDGVIRNQLVGNAIVSTLYNKDGSPVSGTTGDFIYIYGDNGTGTNDAIGQIRTIVDKNSSNSGAPMNAVVDFAWLGIRSTIPTYQYQYNPLTNSYERFTTSTDWIDPITGNEILYSEIKDVCYTVYPDYGDVPIFASSDGLHVLTNDTCSVGSGEFFPYGNQNQITNNNAVPTKLQISSVFNYEGEVGFINSKTGYLIIGLGGYNSGYFVKTLLVGKKYDVAIPFQSYLLIMGRSATGIIYRSSTSTLGTQDVLYSELLTNIGYFSKDSIANDKENVYFVSNEKYIYSIDVTPISDFVYTRFKAKLTDLSEFIRSDLEQLDRTRGDQVTMSSNESSIRLFISDPSTTTAGTKIIFFDTTRKFWYKWMVCGIYLRDEKFGCWYGDFLRSNTGDTDDGQPIKQIVGFSFSEKLYLEKIVQAIRFIVGFNSKISRQNTTLKIEYDSGGWHEVIRFNKFQRAQYVRHIAQSKNAVDGELFESAPIGMGFHGGNGFRPIEMGNYNNEFEAFCSYEPLEPDTYLNACNYANIPNMKGKDCNKTYPADYVPNINDSNNEGYVTISKYGVLKYDLGVYCENLYCELIADRGDKLEFGGLALGYELGDTEINIANVLTFEGPSPAKIPDKSTTKKI